jgi:DNA polymerase-4
LSLIRPRLEQALQHLGLRTIGQVAAQPPELLERRFGEAGRHLHQLSLGIDERPVVPDRRAKSIGAEDTFAEDVDHPEVLRVHLHGQALRVGARLRAAGLQTRVVQLKLKYADFTLVTRRLTLDTATDDGQALYQAAVRLLGRAFSGHKVRLTGVAALELDEPERQLPLFGQDARRRQLNAVLDRIASRFGSQAVVPADLAGEAAGMPDAEDEARRQVGAARFDARPGGKGEVSGGAEGRSGPPRPGPPRRGGGR